MFSFSKVVTTDEFKLIKRININKAIGEDQIPLKLIKTAGNVLVYLLTDISNSCFSTSTFPDLAKRTAVTPIDSGETDQHIYTNYRPVSVLNTSVLNISVFKNNRIINI